MTESSSARPVQKVTAGLLAGAITTILVYVVSIAVDVEIPPTIAAAVTTLIGFLISYVVPPGADEQVVRVPRARHT
jgi:hypothetical protein